MKTNHVIESWKSAEMKQFIGSSSINKEMMAEIQGGSGYIKTVSGECNTSKKSCWEVVREAINTLLDAVA